MLVVNRSYLAVHVVTVRRAFGLVYRQIADIIDVSDGVYASYDFDMWREISEFRSAEPSVCENDEWIHSVNFVIQAPRVIRLVRFDRAPRQTLRFNRRNLLARDNHCCQYCGESLPHHRLSLDHVLPRSRGGKTTWENIVCSCLDCNTRKGDRTPHEARMTLSRPPIRPKQSPLLMMKLGNPKYDVWKSFIPTGAWSVDVK
ncbi:HNH endonuclease [Lignipirellula cremea]|uniref:HNH endonuclease n=1 Tax=Lignipirellula cremea TaxID=2528010 RepID=UPI001E659C19|nr:HNH endonuclease [Lignipirellula cremea]